jgi:hypothetical protein
MSTQARGASKNDYQPWKNEFVHISDQARKMLEVLNKTEGKVAAINVLVKQLYLPLGEQHGLIIKKWVGSNHLWLELDENYRLRWEYERVKSTEAIDAVIAKLRRSPKPGQTLGDRVHPSKTKLIRQRKFVIRIVEIEQSELRRS